jgi:superfamily I DNA/RNA helicase
LRDELNPQQLEAVETAEGPLLILAGAGSGKTRVITYRIAHLIEDAGVEPDSILAVTFTNKAAHEMAERVGRKVGTRHFSKPLISTFHSFCVRVLRRDIEKLQVNGQGWNRNFVIYDESDQQSVVKAATRRLGLDGKAMKPAAVLARISWAKNHMLDAEAAFLQSRDPDAEKTALIFREYDRALAKANALDFDDLLLQAMRLLRDVPEVRQHYHRKFEYILVDEYQDTNRPQYELLRLLANERHNVCAVGDEDQSIYSWRGADIRNILEFERDFPQAKIVRLEQNYRSTQYILQAASAVVAHNQKRKGKNLWTKRQGGSLVGYYEAPDGENEALFAADYIGKYLAQCEQEGREGHAAILYRTNSQSRLFEEALRRYGLKYQIAGGFSFYERAEIKDMVAYLKAIQNPHDSIALQRVINTPARGLGKTSQEVVERLALETRGSLWTAMAEVIDRQLLTARPLSALREFRQLVEDAGAMLAGNFSQRIGATSQAPELKLTGHAGRMPPAAVEAADLSSASGGQEEAAPSSDDDIAFDFGMSAGREGENGEEEEESAQEDQPELEPSPVPTVVAEPDEYSESGQRLFLVPKAKWPSLQKLVQRLAKRATSLGVPEPKLNAVREWTALPPAGTHGARGRTPEHLLVTVEGEPPVLLGWKFLGAIRHKGKLDVRHLLPGAALPETFVFGPPRCDHCHTIRRRKSTFLVQRENGEVKQVGSTCVEDFIGHSAEGHLWFAEALFQLEDKLAEISHEARTQLRESAARQAAACQSPAPESPTLSAVQAGGSGVASRMHPGGVLSNLAAGAEFAAVVLDEAEDSSAPDSAIPAWWHNRAPDSPASTAEILRFVLDRTGYIKQLKAEDSPESLARVENLYELVNAAMDSADRGEDLSQFLDHAALVSDQDGYDASAPVTLMTLHAAKGLEFPLVFLVGLEERLLPHSRTLLVPDEVEEERRLCYVGMTRAMDTLVLSRACYRRRWGSDSPEPGIASRFLEEVPPELLQDLGSPRGSRGAWGAGAGFRYEDEDQRPWYERSRQPGSGYNGSPEKKGQAEKPYNSIDNIAEFFASRGKKFTLRPSAPAESTSGARGFRPGQQVRHPKYGVGTVYRREGDGADAKITVQFQRFGLKKLIEKYAQLEKA